MLRRSISQGTLVNVVWQESNGDPDPIPMGWSGYSSAQIDAWNDYLDAARETYNLFGSLTNGTWLSFDGADATMPTVGNTTALTVS